MYSPSYRYSQRLISKNKASKNTPTAQDKYILDYINNEVYNKGRKFPPMPIPGFQNPNNDDDDDESGPPTPFKFPKIFGGEAENDVFTENNHIYFKTEVTKNSIEKLSGEIERLNNKLLGLKKKTNLGTFTPKPIYLHITTNGGDLLAGFFGYDKIQASKIEIHTIVEGCVASAGSLLSIAGAQRYMTPNSHLLIHQLRTGMFGTYEELVDEKNNCHQFMSRLVSMYHSNCNNKMTKTKIKDFLKRDIFWNSKTAITNGLVDEEWSSTTEQ